MPLPPSAQCVHMKALRAHALGGLHAPPAISASVSVMKRLIATTAGTPNLFTFSMWRLRLSQPLFDGRDVLVLQIILGDAAVHLERADGGDDDGGGRLRGPPCGT